MIQEQSTGVILLNRIFKKSGREQRKAVRLIGQTSDSVSFKESLKERRKKIFLPWRRFFPRQGSRNAKFRTSIRRNTAGFVAHFLSALGN